MPGMVALAITLMAAVRGQSPGFIEGFDQVDFHFNKYYIGGTYWKP